MNTKPVNYQYGACFLGFESGATTLRFATNFVLASLPVISFHYGLKFQILSKNYDAFWQISLYIK